MAECPHCKNGWLGCGDLECINGVVIDIDVFTEGRVRDVIYPLAPCHPHFCSFCGGAGIRTDATGSYDCNVCNGSGSKDGCNDSMERLGAIRRELEEVGE